MDNLFSDLEQILPHLAKLQNKIETLRWLAKQADYAHIHLSMLFPDGTSYLLDQDLIPFNLELEVKNLIDESIDEIQRQHDHLKKLFDETNF